MINEQGAEAKVYEKDTEDGTSDKIVKERLKKGYRIEEIDSTLRKSRTNRETKVLKRLYEAGLNVPEVLFKEDFTIVMEKIEGDKLRDVFEEDPEGFGNKIGKIVRKVHDMDIIHGDLTTSNMILSEDKIFLIDFGLSFFSKKIEDKAVDLHLLEQAIESKHHITATRALEAVFGSYGDKEVLGRLEKVKERGRNTLKGHKYPKGA